jgi:hypothetical protein
MNLYLCQLNPLIPDNIRMNELNKLESTLLEGLTKKYPSFHSHIPYLKVSDRQLTPTGMTIYLTYTNGETSIPIEEINALFSNEEKIQVQNLKNGLAYVIDITDGKIEHIELVTYGEKWNGVIKEFKLVDRLELE